MNHNRNLAFVCGAESIAINIVCGSQCTCEDNIVSGDRFCLQFETVIGVLSRFGTIVIVFACDAKSIVIGVSSRFRIYQLLRHCPFVQGGREGALPRRGVAAEGNSHPLANRRNHSVGADHPAKAGGFGADVQGCRRKIGCCRAVQQQ